MNNNKNFTFFFHDYETFGKNPALDRASQFAGIRTDENLNIIGEPITIYCKPQNDYLPDPEAVLITKITPQIAQKNGLIEPEFVKKIHAEFSQPKTCIVGYNNLRFDDEFTRNLFYRNFYDPYEYSFQNQNSRWDLIDLVRACFALRPNGINWPKNENGLPSFKLEELSKANNLSHENAHDATSDVFATIAVAQLIKKNQPKLFDYYFNLRSKHEIKKQFDLQNLSPLVFISSFFGTERGNLSLISPISWHFSQPNSILVCDLFGDLELLLSLSAEEIKQKMFMSSKNLDKNETRVPLFFIKINQCPFIAPAKTLTNENAARFSFSLEKCKKNWDFLQKNITKIRNKIQILFEEITFEQKIDVDEQIYSGFFDSNAKKQIQFLREFNEKNQQIPRDFADFRLKELFFRFRARNFPQTLDETEIKNWINFKQEKLNETFLQNYLLKINELIEKNKKNTQNLHLLNELISYFHTII